MEADDMLTPKEVAAELRITERALAAMRSRGTGPPYLRVTERTIRYSRTDLAEWLASKSRR
jgi:hypothetical protein